jgi:ferredoxin
MAASGGQADRIVTAREIHTIVSKENLVMKVRVDPDLCIGCGICPDVAPEVFEMGSDDKAHTKVDPVPEELQAACKDAADQCPQAAIEVDVASTAKTGV